MAEKTLLQDFSESVVADVLGVPKSEVSGAVSSGGGVVGFDPIALLAFIEAIMAMIAQLMDNCPAPAVDVRESVKHPTIRQRVGVRVLVAREANACCEPGMRRRSGAIATSLIRLGSQQDDATIDAILADCRANAYGQAG